MIRKYNKSAGRQGVQIGLKTREISEKRLGNLAVSKIIGIFAGRFV